MTKIEDTGFYNCNLLTSVTIPEGVTAIGDTAFRDCALLESVSLPDSLRTIGSWAFAGCPALQTLTLPDGVTSVADNAFDSCPARVYAAIGSDGAKAYSNVYSGYFYVAGNDNVKLRYTASNGEITGLTVKAASTEIGAAVIPAGVTSLADNAFDGCASLAEVSLPESLKTIGAYAFRGCASLGTVTIPAGVTSISGSAFPKAQEKLTGVCVTAGMTWAKNNNYPLDTEAEPGSYCYAPIHAWGEAAYAWADDNSAVTATRVCANDVNRDHVQTETAAAQSALTKSPTETEAGEHTFRSAAYQNEAFAAQTKIAADVSALGTLTGLTLPASLTEIESEAFEFGAFQYVIVPASCGSIGQKAFAYCDAMVYIKIPASVAEIALDAFEGCGSSLVIDRLE